ncbi:uncharacterized protein LOC131887810 isoform X3 [Tigriopus californicus]|uniref:uncharacterized protein LOC131887810 isoform X3 n=1 Tax=Tigriopus californicus TaxID=6832 RepID=UPI0027DA8C05|nr:uncharacterized protein LOC131887810 isoform X3 [Tigriopus californicus]
MAEGRRKLEQDSQIVSVGLAACEKHPDGVEINPKNVSRRRASPQWKGHFDKLSDKWGTISSASSSVAGSLPTSPIPYHLWGDLEKQKEQGGYPWTHLSHNQEEEVWIDPLKLPRDISAATIRRRDKSIPREWFHLPEGAEPPSVEELLRESSSDDDNVDDTQGAQRAKSPPLCGRGRSKSRERKLNKHKLSSQAQDLQAEYEIVHPVPPQDNPFASESSLKGLSSPFTTYNALPSHDQTSTNAEISRINQEANDPHVHLKQEIVINKEAEDDSDSTGCFPLTRRSRSRSKSKEKKTGKRSTSRHQSENAYALPPRTDVPGREGQISPPEVNRDKKPTPKSIKTKHQGGKSNSSRDEGYEPVGQRRTGFEGTSSLVKLDTREGTNPFLIEDNSPNITKEYEDVQPFGPPLLNNGQSRSPQQQRSKERLEQIMIEEELKMKKLTNNTTPSSRDVPLSNTNNVETNLKIDQASNPFEIPEEANVAIGTSSEMGNASPAKIDRAKEESDQHEKEVAKQKAKQIAKLKEKQTKEEEKKREKNAKEAKSRKEKEEQPQREKRDKEEKLQKIREGKLQKEKEEREEKLRKEEEILEEKLRKEQLVIDERLRKEEAKEEKRQKERDVKEEKLRRERESKEEKQRKEKEIKEKKESQSQEPTRQKEKEANGKVSKNELEREQSNTTLHDHNIAPPEVGNGLSKHDQKPNATDDTDNKKSMESSKVKQESNSQTTNLNEERYSEAIPKNDEDLNPFGDDRKAKYQDKSKTEEPSTLQNPFEEGVFPTNEPLHIDKNDWDLIKQELFHEDGDAQEIIFTPFEKDDETPMDVNRLEKQAQDQIAELFQSNTLEKKKRKEGDALSKQNDEYEDVAELSAEELKKKQQEDEASRQQRLKAQYLKEQEELKAKKDAKRKNKRRDKSQDSKLSFSFFSSSSSQKGGDDDEMEGLVKPSHSSRYSLETNGSEMLDSHSRISKKERAKLEKEAQKEKKRIEKLEKEQQKIEKKEMEEKSKQDQLIKQAELAKLAKEQKEEQKRKKQEEKEHRKNAQEEKDKKQTELAKLALQQKEDEKKKKEEEKERKEKGKREKEMKQAELAKLALEQKQEAKRRKEQDKESKEQAQKEHEMRQAELAKLALEQKEEEKRRKLEEKETKDNAKKDQEMRQAELARLAFEQKEEEKRRKLEEKENKDLMKKEEEKRQAELAKIALEQKAEERRRKLEEKEDKNRTKKEQEKKQEELARLALEQKEEQRKKKLEGKEEKDRMKMEEKRRQEELAKLALEEEEGENRQKVEENEVKDRIKKEEGKLDMASSQQKKKTNLDPHSQKCRETHLLTQDNKDSVPKEKTISTSDMHDLEQESDITNESNIREQELKIEQQKKEIDDMQMLISLANEEPPKSSDLNEGNWPVNQNVPPLHESTAQSNGGQKSGKEEISNSRKDLNKRSFLSKLFHTKSGKAKSMSNLDDPAETKEDERTFEPVIFSASSARPTIEPSNLSPEEKDANKTRPTSEHLYEPILGSPKPSPLADRKDQLKEIVESPTEDNQDSPPGLPLKNKNKRAKHRSQEAPEAMAAKTSNSTSFWKFGSKKNNDEPDLVKNGFHDEDDAEEDEEDMDTSSAGGKDRKSRDRKKKPGLGTKMKNFRLPSPGEVANGYLSSNFHQKNFKQPLVSRSRMEDQDLQRIRQLTVERNTPSELASLSHPFDIPLPKFRKNRSKSNKRDESESEDGGHAPNRLYGTLPRSWREQNLVTGVKENVDPNLVKERQELVKTKSPSELAQFRSITDFPVPSKIQNIFSTNKKNPQRQAEKRRHSASSVEATPEGWTKSLPRSWKDTKLVTNVKEYQPNDIVKQRQELVSTKKPHELAQIHGFSDFPVPALFKRSRSSSGTRDKESRKRASRTSSVVSITRSVGGTLSRGWKDTKLVTKVKVEPDSDTLTMRRNLIQAKSPAELAQITSVADFPIPTALEHFWKSDKPKESEGTEKKGTHKSMSNLEDMYSNLPRALKTECLVRSKIEDEEVLKKRQKLVETMKPGELASITSISDIPIPSALENIFKSSDKPEPPARRNKDIEEKRKRNRSVGALLSYEGLPESLKAEVLVRSKVEEDPEEVRVRQELVKNKTPSQLASINSFSDFPLPKMIDTMVRPGRRTLKSTKQKDLEKKRSQSWASLPETSSGMFSSLKRDLEVSRVQEPDQETVRKRRDMLKNKSVSDLAQIGSLADFPVPTVFQNMVGTSKRDKSVEKNRSETPTGKKESLYEKLPASLRQECLVRVKDENPELQKKRQELTRAKSPTELGNIGSLSDIPIPSPIQNLLHRKSETGSPIPPPRRKDRDDHPKSMYERLPESLKTEVLVRSVVEADEKVLRQRQEMTRSMSPAQLSEIHGFSDFPMPSFKKKKDQSEERGKSQEKENSTESERGSGLYATLPKSLKSEVLVRAKMEDPEVQRQRAEVVKSKSVHELSQITSLSDIPMPAFVSKGPRPVERKKRFREKQRSNSAKNLYETLPRTLRSELLVKQTVQDQALLQQRRRMAGSKSVQELSQIHSLGEFPLPGWLSKSKPDVSASGMDSKRTSMSNLSSKQHIYSTMPKSLTQEMLVRAVIQDPTVINQRRALTQSKSVSELAQINSLADFPIPSTLSRMISRKKDKSRDNESRTETMSTDPESKESGLYATLPKSLKTEVLVRSRMEDPEILRYRQQLAQSKSVGELASIGGFSDFPLPTPIQNLFTGKRRSKREPSKEPEKERERSNSSRPGSRGPSNDMYASLPRSLKTELQVRSMQEGDTQTLKERRALVESKSPAELGQIHSFSEIPVPRMVEDWLHSSESKKGLDSPQRPSRSAHELRGGGLYETLPRSLKEPVLVGSTVEDPDLARQRAELTRSKSPSELAAIRGLGDIPIPGLWSHDSGRTREKKKKDVKEPPKESNKMGTLTRPCVVRSKIEDPEILRQRQELQQNKSIHELSKINNVNEIPLPFKIPLPDIPFPQPTKIFTLFKKKPAQEPVVAASSEIGYTPSASPVTNADTTEAELLRFETSSMDMDTHREQDFGYEVIDRTLADVNQLQDDFEGDDELSEREVHPKVGQAPTSLRKDLATARHQPGLQSQNQQRLDDDEQLVEQYRGTPERKVPSRNKRRTQPHPASSPRHEFPRSESPPPPLPPKKPGGRREEIIDDYEDEEDEEMEVVPVKGILTLEASNGNLQVRKNEYKEIFPSSSSPIQPTSSRGKISPRISSPASPSFLTEVGYGESPTPPPTLPVKTRVGGGGGSDTHNRTKEIQPHIRIGHESPRLDSYDEVFPASLNLAPTALNLKVPFPNEIHESPECATLATLSQPLPVFAPRRRKKQERVDHEDCPEHDRKENILVQTECPPSFGITNSVEECSLPSSSFLCDSSQDQENPILTGLESEREIERITTETDLLTTDDDVERIQSRPLPAPPAPKRTLKKKPSPKKQESHPLSPEMKAASLEESHDEASLKVPNSLMKRSGSSASNKSASRLSMKSPIPSSDASFHTAVQSSMDRTLVDSSEVRRRDNMDEDEETLADSIVDSMHSCADTIVVSDDDLTLNEQGGDTDMEGDDDPLSEHFHSIPLNTASESMEQYVRRMQETPTPPAGSPMN